MLPSPGLLILTTARESWAAATQAMSGKIKLKPAILIHKLEILDGIADLPLGCDVRCRLIAVQKSEREDAM